MSLRREVGDRRSNGYWQIPDIELSELQVSSIPRKGFSNVRVSSLDENAGTIHFNSHYRERPRISHRRCPSGTAMWRRSRKVTSLGKHQEGICDNKPTYRGWRKAVMVATATTGAVALINIILGVVFAKRYPTNDKGLVTLKQGDCEAVKRMNTMVHLAINILSTALLGASNYTMQCLGSPTRAEVNAAHIKGKSLYIGVPSIRNFLHMRPLKGVLWLCLCLSTLPLHFLWNSAIFSTSAVNLVTYVIANENFLSKGYTGPDLDSAPCNGGTPPMSIINDIYQGYRANAYTNLTIKDCSFRYTEGSGVDSRNLILITDTSSDKLMSLCGFRGHRWNGSSVMAVDTNLVVSASFFNQSIDSFPAPVPPTQAQNNTNGYYNTKPFLNLTSNTWRVGSYPIKYCLSETMSTSHCRLEYAPFILYIVVVCNLLKVVCMSMTVVWVWNLDESILATVGDAVASFLDTKDETTAGMCLLSVIGFEKVQKSQKNQTATLPHWIASFGKQDVEKYNRNGHGRIFDAISVSSLQKTAFAIFAFWSLGLIATLHAAIRPVGEHAPLTLKFGAADANALIGASGESKLNLFLQVLLANAFQCIFSITYFLYNGMFTAQCGAMEWAQLARRKFVSLRVTWPRGQQRSTYFLHLPWRYGIPLTVLQILMHFCLSQSIFLARLVYYDSTGKAVPIEERGYLSVGYSPPAIVTTMILWTVVVFAIAFHTFKAVSNHVPPHGNQSIVISAMCHPEGYDRQGSQDVTSSSGEPEPLSTKTLMWGVTSKPEEVFDESEQGTLQSHHFPGHCTFTDRFVDLPEMGQRYT